MISFESNGNRFKHRVAGVCLHGDRILLATAEPADYHFLPGGRVEFFEDSVAALEREMREELGSEVETGRLLWIVENFFDLDGESYHEVSLIYEMRPKDTSILDLAWTHKTTDAGIGISFKWWPLDALKEANLKPEFLRESLKKPPETTTHLVVR